MSNLCAYDIYNNFLKPYTFRKRTKFGRATDPPPPLPVLSHRVLCRKFYGKDGYLYYFLDKDY